MSSTVELATGEFRNLHPLVSLGTASDRYGGWIGVVYAPGRYEEKITRRIRTVGDRDYTEQVLPVESVAEYFSFFPALELDFTFYQTLLPGDGRPSPALKLLRSYRRMLKKGDGIFLKVPQQTFAKQMRRGKSFQTNKTYLNPELFTRGFYEPATEVLGGFLQGFVFEQEYHRARERTNPDELASSLERFFRAVPGDDRYHVELRTSSYLTAPVFAALERCGVGHVLSHWTWLPTLAEQFEQGGRKFYNRGGRCLVRLMTPRGMRYEDSYQAAFPFDKIVNGMTSPRMVHETSAIMWEAVRKKVRVTVIVNNRSGGCAPLVARMIADRFLVEQTPG